MIALPILQSGFLANNELNLLRSLENKEDLFSSLTTRPFKERFNPYFFNPEVEDVFTQFMTNNTLLKNIEFREKILKIAKYNFGNFGNFLKNQVNSPLLSPMHSKFLIDTLRYIDTGHRREVDIISWPSLVRIKSGKNANSDLMKYLGKDVLQEIRHEEVLFGKISETLSYWTRRRQGFIDLLYSLKIIFGKVIDRVQV